MSELQVKGVKNAIILFADLVESSVYSSVWGYEEYAEQIMLFQKLFVELGKVYFPQVTDSDKYYEIKARGDEGLIFIYDETINPSTLVYKLIEFAFELKARLKVVQLNRDDQIPKKIDIGFGIHYGPVAIITETILDKKDGINRSVLSRIEGYTINYCKRVESASRDGRCSKIYISSEANKYLDRMPVLLDKKCASLKGVDNNVDLYEVRGAVFDDMPQGLLNSDNYYEYYCDIKNININWEYTVAIATIQKRINTIQEPELKKRYYDSFVSFLWSKPHNDDPLIQLYRAIIKLKEKEYTDSLKYYKMVLDVYPYFNYAKIQLIRIVYLIGNNRHTAEIIYARDLAREYVSHFSDYLTSEERKIFTGLINKYK